MWTGDFTDYTPGEEQFYELAWGWENLQINQSHNASAVPFSKGIYLAGNNHSDDLFMFIKSAISNLKANTKYSVNIIVDFASDVPVDSLGSGGAQGESVHFKVGASTQEPIKIISKGLYDLSVDKGNQKQGGKNAIVVGNIANPLVDPKNPQFAPKQVGNFDHPLSVMSNDKGQIWVFVGTDSGYEGITKYYIGRLHVILWEIS